MAITEKNVVLILSGIYCHELAQSTKSINRECLLQSFALNYLSDEIQILIRSNTNVIHSALEEVIQKAMEQPALTAKEYTELLHDCETMLLNEIVLGRETIKKPYREISQLEEEYYREKRLGPGVLDLIIPELNSHVGKLKAGRKLLIGGFSDSFKSVLLTNLLVNKIKENTTPILLVCADETKEYIGSILYGLSEGSLVNKMRLVSWTIIRSTFPKLTIIGINEIKDERSTRSIRKLFTEWINRCNPSDDPILGITGLKELGFWISPVGERENTAILRVVELLKEFTSSGSTLSILATYRFSEKVYSRLQREVSFYDSQRRRIGFEHLETSQALSEIFVGNKMLEDEIRVHNEKLADSLTVKPLSLEKLFLPLDKKIDEIKRSITKIGGSILNDFDSYQAPHGQYKITDFQEILELEQFFDVCLSTWCDVEFRESGSCLVKLVKNKEGTIMEKPVPISFQKSGDKWNEITVYKLHDPTAKARDAGKYIKTLIDQ